MKKSFSKQGLKSLILKVNRLNPHNLGDSKIILATNVYLIWEILYRFIWLKLVSDHDDVIDVDNRRSLPTIYSEFLDLCRQVPELRDYDLSNGNPTDMLIKCFTIDLQDALESHSSELCIIADQLTPMLSVVVNYNFTNEFQDFVPEEFKRAEGLMKKIAKGNRWAARGTWNATVDKSEVLEQKVKKDLSFLKKFKALNSQGDDSVGTEQLSVSNMDSGENSVGV